MRTYLPVSLLLLTACKDQEVNIFTIDDDKELGAQLLAEIEADPETYPPLLRDDYPEAYEHIERIRDSILASDDIRYRDEFTWEVRLIDDDETLNAFAAPGGYIWVYTGLIRFLESEDQLAGVMGHEIAHADRRHSTQQLTKIYGISTMLSVALGEDPGLLAEIAAGLASLEFSREHEADADDYSVIYLCDTEYASNGAAGFFELLEGQMEIPEFLSTHPSSEGRIEDINAKAEELGCSVEPNPNADYQAVKDSLPPL
jgi:predicted Zn-dependent protease